VIEQSLGLVLGYRSPDYRTSFCTF